MVTPFWQAQTRHGSGFQISLCWYVLPSTVQPSPFFASMTEACHRSVDHKHVTLATGSGLLTAVLWADCGHKTDHYEWENPWKIWWQRSEMSRTIDLWSNETQPQTCIQRLNPQRFNVRSLFSENRKKKKTIGKKNEEKVKIKSSCSLKPSLCGWLFQEKPQKKITGSDWSPLTTERNHTHKAPHYKQHDQNLSEPDRPEPN